MKPILPLLTMGNDGEFERRAIEENELNVGEGVDLLGFIAQLNVLSDGLVKV